MKERLYYRGLQLKKKTITTSSSTKYLTMTVKCTLKGNWKNNTISLVVVCCLELRLRNFVDHYVFDDGILWMFPNSVNGVSLFGETVVEPRGCLFERRILRTIYAKSTFLVTTNY